MPLTEVEGQVAAVSALKRALAHGRLHHAYLFAGPAGVGKSLAARGLACALLCVSPTTDGDACGRCNACARCATQQHPDLHVLARKLKDDGAPEQQIKIEQVRELQRALGFKAFEGSRRVVLILEAERMNPATANALLKTLEEPGVGTHFALVSSAPHLLLPTIVSRCQRLRFGPLSREVVARRVAAAAQLDLAHADLVAGLAEGSIGRALELAQSDLLVHRAELLARVDDPKGLEHVMALLDLAEDLAGRRAELPLFFQLLRTWYRDILLVHERLPEARLVHRDLATRARDRASALSSSETLDRLDRINEADRTTSLPGANLRLTLETLFLWLAEPRQQRRATA